MARTKANIDIPNLRGKLALVTGASDGLWLRSWLDRLARAGAEVIMPVPHLHQGRRRKSATGSNGSRLYPRTGPPPPLCPPSLDLAQQLNQEGRPSLHSGSTTPAS